MSITDLDKIPPHLRHDKAIVNCKNIANHEYGPFGYNEWHSWADKRRKTHTQEKCECGRYLIWKKK